MEFSVWNPNYPALDELPAIYAIRPLVVIPIQDKVAKDINYHLTVEDILTWEKKHGRIAASLVSTTRPTGQVGFADDRRSLLTYIFPRKFL